jgi:hypothetical protein
MSQAADLTPPIDSTVEQESIGFDFGLILGPGVSISAVVSLTCTVDPGSPVSDATPSIRLIGSSFLIPSNQTTAPAAAVAQMIGSMVAGVIYLLQCVVLTSDGQRLSLWTRMPCISPR